MKSRPDPLRNRHSSEPEGGAELKAEYASLAGFRVLVVPGMRAAAELEEGPRDLVILTRAELSILRSKPADLQRAILTVKATFPGARLKA